MGEITIFRVAALVVHRVTLLLYWLFECREIESPSASGRALAGVSFVLSSVTYLAVAWSVAKDAGVPLYCFLIFGAALPVKVPGDEGRTAAFTDGGENSVWWRLEHLALADPVAGFLFLAACPAVGPIVFASGERPAAFVWIPASVMFGVVLGILMWRACTLSLRTCGMDTAITVFSWMLMFGCAVFGSRRYGSTPAATDVVPFMALVAVLGFAAARRIFHAKGADSVDQWRWSVVHLVLMVFGALAALGIMAYGFSHRHAVGGVLFTPMVVRDWFAGVWAYIASLVSDAPPPPISEATPREILVSKGGLVLGLCALFSHFAGILQLVEAFAHVDMAHRHAILWSATLLSGFGLLAAGSLLTRFAPQVFHCFTLPGHPNFVSLPGGGGFMLPLLGGTGRKVYNRHCCSRLRAPHITDVPALVSYMVVAAGLLALVACGIRDNTAPQPVLSTSYVAVAALSTLLSALLYIVWPFQKGLDRKSAHIPAGEDIKANDELGGFVIMSKLGSGTSGAVFSAHLPILDAYYALKVVNVLHSTAAMADAKREATTLMRMTPHPHLVKYHHAFEYRTRRAHYVCLAMTLAPNTLQHYIQHMKPEHHDMLTVYHLARGLASGLTALHSTSTATGSRLIHRDLKPANIGLTSTHPPEPIILDFGASEEVVFTEHVVRQRPGTPLYTSPNRARGQHSSEDDDCWALGLILAELCLGEPLEAMCARHGVNDTPMTLGGEWVRDLVSRVAEKDRNMGIVVGGLLRECTDGSEQSRIPASEAWQFLDDTYRSMMRR